MIESHVSPEALHVAEEGDLSHDDGLPILPVAWVGLEVTVGRLDYLGIPHRILYRGSDMVDELRTPITRVHRHANYHGINHHITWDLQEQMIRLINVIATMVLVFPEFILDK